MMRSIVSRETIAQLDIYKKLLLKWQNSINLVSRDSLENLQERHFEDSLQLLEYFPQDCFTHIDLGSGAGFPGLVLKIASQDLKSTLVESDQRKCEFLKTVSRETKTPVKILNARIEDLSSELTYDIITARALASLTQLLTYSFPLLHCGSHLYFLKGRGYSQEIEEAQKKWDFDLEIFPSSTHSEGVIIHIQRLTPKEG